MTSRPTLAGLVGNAGAWADIAIATLAFATSQADVDGWSADNGRYLAKLKRTWPAEHARIVAAIEAKGFQVPT